MNESSFPTVSFDNLTMSDYRLYLKVAGYHTLQSAQGKTSGSTLSGFVVIVLFLIVFLTVFQWVSIWGALASVVVLIILIFGFREYQLRKVVRLSKGPIHVTVEEAGIRWSDASIDSLTRW